MSLFFRLAIGLSIATIAPLNIAERCSVSFWQLFGSSEVPFAENHIDDIIKIGFDLPEYQYLEPAHTDTDVANWNKWSFAEDLTGRTQLFITLGNILRPRIGACTDVVLSYLKSKNQLINTSPLEIKIRNDVTHSVLSFLEGSIFDQRIKSALACCSTQYAAKYGVYGKPKDVIRNYKVAAQLEMMWLVFARQNPKWTEYIVSSMPFGVQDMFSQFDKYAKSVRKIVKDIGPLLLIVINSNMIDIYHKCDFEGRLLCKSYMRRKELASIAKILVAKEWNVKNFWSSDLDAPATEWNPYSKQPMSKINTECGLPEYIKLLGRFCKTKDDISYNVFILRIKDSIILLPTITDETGKNLQVAKIIFYNQPSHRLLPIQLSYGFRSQNDIMYSEIADLISEAEIELLRALNLSQSYSEFVLRGNIRAFCAHRIRWIIPGPNIDCPMHIDIPLGCLEEARLARETAELARMD